MGLHIMETRRVWMKEQEPHIAPVVPVEVVGSHTTGARDQRSWVSKYAASLVS